MKTFRFILGVFVATVWCASAASAAQNPPPVNLAVLQGYSRGSNSIVGTTHFSKEGTAYCAPDIPYVNWYVAQLNSPRRPAYAVLLSRYTRTAPIGKDGTFTCANVARGRYTVWIEGQRRVGGGFVADPVVRDEAMNSTGQVSGTTNTAAARNGDKAVLGSDSVSGTVPFFAGPKHVVVGSGAVKVAF